MRYMRYMRHMRYMRYMRYTACLEEVAHLLLVEQPQRPDRLRVLGVSRRVGRLGENLGERQSP